MKIAFVIPGELDQPTGGYQYDKQIIDCWQSDGVGVEVINLPGQYPMPDEQDRQTAMALAENLGRYDHVVIDGLAGGGSPNLIEKLAEKAPVTALVHHPLCLESGLTAAEQDALRISEGAGLAYVCGVISTSKATAETVATLFAIDPAKIRVVEPGVSRGQIASPWESGPVKLLCVGSLIERKGHTYLIEALSDLSALNWQLDCYGSDEYDPVLASKLREWVSDMGLQNRIRFHGSVTPARLEKAYEDAHLFVLPSLYEGYGMVLAEAIVRGLPVVSTNAGAIPQTVPKGCGVLVEPANSKVLADVLRRLIDDHSARQALRTNVLASASRLPVWQQSADLFLSHLAEFS